MLYAIYKLRNYTQGKYMKRFLIAGLLLASQASLAVSIKDYTPYNYEVYFTNPICKEYKYDEAVYSNDGSYLSSKPKNVYCKSSDDVLNANRETSPQYQLVKLVNDKDVNEMFLTFLSFSNKTVTNAICDAIEDRNLKVTVIVDSKNLDRPGSTTKNVEKISKCRAKNLQDGEQANIPKTMYRGNKGGFGYAHNKIIIANYKSNPEKVKIVYGSGNMSSGAILHHENWHFVTTNINSYFVQAHYCVKEGMINITDKKSNYKKFINKCRKNISAEEETDITFYIVPTDGAPALKRITKAMKKAVTIDGAAHRITHPAIWEGLAKASADDKKKVRFVVDDDIYWTGKRNIMTGSNNFSEFANVMKMVKANVDVRYMESNQNQRMLHHNKYLIFNYADGSGSVHAGAGNFTKAAFTKNFENYYFINLPEVVEIFRKQYEHKFNDLATSYDKMPKTYVNP